MKGANSNESEVDKLLDPIAKSILRDLQDLQLLPDQHISQDHMTPPEQQKSATLVLDNSQVIKCDDSHLTWNELVHCNIALEKDGKDADGNQGGQSWGIILDAPLTLIISNGIVTVTLDDGTTIKCNRRKDLTENEIIHCKMALEREPVLGVDSEGNPIWGRYNGDGNPDVEGLYEEEGDLILGVNPDGTMIQGGYVDYKDNGNLAFISTTTKAMPTISPVPTFIPTTTKAMPTISPVPTLSSSWHPTLSKNLWLLKGIIYYDRNANGGRDSDVNTVEFGEDVEYNYGLGGVTIQLIECDVETNKEVVSEDLYGEGKNSYASTISQGYDVRHRAKLAGPDEEGGKYNLVNIKVNRAYYIYVTAPGGYLFSGGVCNDKVPGWECTNAASKDRRSLRVGTTSVVGRRRRLNNGAEPKGLPTPDTYIPPSEEELGLGLYAARSENCVRVDRFGKPESHLNLGVMRIGDVKFAETDVELSLDMIKPDIEVRGRRRSLLDDVWERILQQDLVMTQNEDGSYSYVLLQKDKEAIGIVTSEVLASNLDIALPEKGAVLDSVTPIDVVYFALGPEELENFDDSNNSTAVTDATLAREEKNTTRESPNAVTSRRRTGTRGKLSVNVLVKGHYNGKDIRANFDSIVQESINRDTDIIRERLTAYNLDCATQTTKVFDMNYTVDNFLEIHSDRGVNLPKSRLQLDRRQKEKIQNEVDPQAFSSACDGKRVLPKYFEESLGGLRLNAKSETRVHVIEERGSNAGPIIGSVLAVALVSLCMGYYVYRREEKKHYKTKEVDVTHFISGGHSLARSINSDVMSEKRRSFVGGVGGRRTSMNIGGESLSSYKTSDDTLIKTPIPCDKRRGITGRIQHELSIIGIALNDERQRIRGDDAQNSATGELETVVQENMADGEGDADDFVPPTETNFDEDAMTQTLSGVVARIRKGRRDRTKELNDRVARRNAKDGGGNKSHMSSSNRSGNPRHVMSQNINVDFKGIIKSKKRSSGSDSSSSSDGGESSDSSSNSGSSSSEEEPETPSQLKAHRKR